MEAKTTSSVPPSTMTTKAPVSTSTSSGTSSLTQSQQNSVSSSKPSSNLANNNNNKISDTATSIITAPLMSQSQAANQQKQASSNVTPATTSTPVKAGTTSNTGGQAPVTTSSISTSSGSVINSKNSKGPTSDTTVVSSTPSAPTANINPVKSLPLTKPVDLPATPANMNVGATAVMKQPPPPVTILPPTPAATPPPVHRQPVTLPPQPPSQTQSGTAASAANTSNQNQKSQSVVDPPPPSSNNNTPVKQSSTSVIQKNQEKPTQPLPPQLQSNSSSTSSSRQDQQVEASGNREQKPISGVNSTVTTSAASVNKGTSANSASAKPTPGTQTSGGPGIRGGQPVQSTPAATNNTVLTPSIQSVKPQVSTGITMESGGEIPSTEVKPPVAINAENKETKSVNQPLPTSKDVGGGDAQILSSRGNTQINNRELETVKKSSSVNDSAEKASTDKPGTKIVDNAKTGDNNILSNSNDMTKSIYIPTNNEQTGKYDNHKPNKGKKEEIGEDVRRIMEAIENAGLCGPKQPEYSSLGSGPDSNISNSSGEIAKNSRNNRSSNSMKNKSQGRPGTASSTNKGQNAGSPTKPRPSTASSLPKKDITGGNEITGSPNAIKNSKGKAAPASGTSNGTSAATLPPKSATSGLRTSTSRVASARGNTAPITSKTPNENKNTKANVNGVDSCSASPVDTETGNSSAGGSRSTPRLRPSSSLYRPTASSALKGVSSAPQNISSNQNLHSSPSTPRTSRSSTGARPSRSAITMGDSAGGSGDAKPATIREQFTAFARFGNKEEDGKHITLSNCDKWMKQAKVIDAKKITTTDTSICFKKLFKTAKKITFEDFKKYVEELAKSKKIEPQEILDKLANCGPPGLSSATRAAHSNVVDRLTDTSKYTGSHKERFDSTGKGRGIEGRKDVSDGSGYVAAFKEKLDLKEKEIEAKESASASPTPAK